jgi:hypothetical protein
MTSVTEKMQYDKQGLATKTVETVNNPSPNHPTTVRTNTRHPYSINSPPETYITTQQAWPASPNQSTNW